MDTNRRGLIGLLSLSAFGVAAEAGTALAGTKQLELGDLRKTAPTACLYHCDFGDPKRFAQVLNNIGNHLAAYDNDPAKIKIVIVTHSAAVRFFLADVSGTPWEKETLEPEIYERFVNLTKHGLEAYLCRVTFKRLNIDPAKARAEPFLSFVPSGVATVADLQTKGYAYLKVG